MLTDPFITNSTGWFEIDTALPYRMISRPLRNWQCLQNTWVETWCVAKYNALNDARGEEQSVVAQAAEHGQLLQKLAFDGQGLPCKICDRFPVHLQRALNAGREKLCWAHLRRDAEEGTEHAVTATGTVAAAICERQELKLTCSKWALKLWGMAGSGT
jgi:hypothetical protein